MAATADLMIELARVLEEPDAAARRAGTARLVVMATGAVFGAVVVLAGEDLELSLAGPAAAEAPVGPAAAVVNAWLQRHHDPAAALMRGGDGPPPPVGPVVPGFNNLLSGLAPFGVGSLLVTPLSSSGTAGLLLAFFGLGGEQDDDTSQRVMEALARLLPALRRSNRPPEIGTMGAVFDALPDAVEVYDAPGQLLRVNARHRDLFGARPVRPGMTERDVLAALGAAPAPAGQPGPDAAAGDAAPLELAVSGAGPTALERVRADWDGGLDDRGSLALYRDVSRLKRLERQKDEFLSLASHELKNPITPIKGYSQMLGRRLRRAAEAGADGPDFDFGRAALEADQILEESDRLNRRVDQLLDVSRIQIGSLRLLCRKLDLRVVLPERIERLRMALEGRRLTYTPPRGRIPLVVDADEDRLTQVISNLVENAARYSPPETAIAVRLQVAASAAGQPRCAVMSVRDRGMGIEGADREQIFDQFYRATKSTALQPLGLGLGLYISREIVRQHGGRIWAESAGPGKGSLFVVELPLVDIPAP